MSYLRREFFYRVYRGKDVHPLTVVKLSNTIAKYELNNPNCTGDDIRNYINNQIRQFDRLAKENALISCCRVRFQPFLMHIEAKRGPETPFTVPLKPGDFFYTAMPNSYMLRDFHTISYQIDLLM